MKEPIFTGAGVAIITPFNEDGVNFEEFGRIIEDQIAGGTDAIVVTGTTGEAATMSDAEHKEAIKFVVAFLSLQARDRTTRTMQSSSRSMQKRRARTAFCS